MAQTVEAARAAATSLQPSFSTVVSSDQLRARETAERFAEALGLDSPQRFPGLRERDVGEFTGLTRFDIEQRWPGLLARPGPIEPPGAESHLAVLARAVATLQRVAALHRGDEILAVTHGALIRSVEAHLGVTVDRPPANLCGRWVTVTDGTLTAGPRWDLRVSSAGRPESR